MSFRDQRRVDTRNGSIPCKAVIQIDLTTGEEREYRSVNAACKAVDGHSPSTLCKVCKNKPGYKTYLGYGWRYKDERQS